MDQNKFSYLYEITKILPQNDCGKFVRSQIMDKLLSVNNFNLPAQNFKESVICQACGVPLVNCPPKMKLQGPKKPNRAVRRTIRLQEKNKPLSIKQDRILRIFQKKNFLKMITTCQSCNNKNETNIKKVIKMPVIHQDIVEKRLKKKKKKDVFSGLNKEAVQQVLNNTTKKLEKNLKISQKGPKSTNKSPKFGNTNKKRNKIQQGRIQKNEVLRKTEKNQEKSANRLKNLSKILQEKPTTSGSNLTNFLKSL